MKGANKALIEQKERFLDHNLIVMQSALQDTLMGWAALNNQVNSRDLDESHFGDVWEFDLVEVPRLFDTFGSYQKSPNGKPPKVYELRLLNRIDNVPTGKLDSYGNKIIKPVTRKIGKYTNKLVGYYCPWSGDKVWTLDLDDRADFFFTASLNGCTVAVEGSVNPKVSHANYVDPLTDLIDQTRIDTELAQRHTGHIDKVSKTDYTNVSKKTRRLARGEVLDYLATVIGFRDPKNNQWSFYYQSYKKFQKASAANPSVTLNNAVMRGRAVKI